MKKLIGLSILFLSCYSALSYGITPKEAYIRCLSTCNTEAYNICVAQPHLKPENLIDLTDPCEEFLMKTHRALWDELEICRQDCVNAVPEHLI